MRRSLRSHTPIDLRLTLAPLLRGRGDPTMRFDGPIVRRAMRTPQGAAQLQLQASNDGVEAQAWGPGAEWTLEVLPDIVGAGDDPGSFQPHHRIVHEIHRRTRGLRLLRCPTVCEILIPKILEQKVTTIEATRSYRALVMALGEPAPGPEGLRLPPAPALLATTPYYEWHRFGVERRRAETIRGACGRAPSVEGLVDISPSVAQRKLMSLPGVGRWTAAEVGRIALGDRDAVRIGDFHLPHLVSWVLAGEPRSDDARMMELLEPYRGERARAVRLIELSGLGPARRAPRRRLRSIARL
ncbi:MAG TPA: DNA-3-methyladenine glycosylase 2 family protein [Actinomycetota bacterium]|nr:DNA-3-methyladenine glycosylase 2 family protein [Actinomycetota bacterium]